MDWGLLMAFEDVEREKYNAELLCYEVMDLYEYDGKRAMEMNHEECVNV